MSKPVSKKDAVLKEKIEELDKAPILDAQFKRDQRRHLKRKRNKYLRSVAKEKLREVIGDTLEIPKIEPKE